MTRLQPCCRNSVTEESAAFSNESITTGEGSEKEFVSGVVSPNIPTFTFPTCFIIYFLMYCLSDGKLSIFMLADKSGNPPPTKALSNACLLYTSDAADEED